MIRFRITMWCMVVMAIAGLVLPAMARDYKTVVNGETIYFDLDRTQIAIGFAEGTTAGERATLMASLSALSSTAPRRAEAPLRMTVFNMKPGVTETDILSTLSTLEASPIADWAGPVLLFDGQEHVPARDMYVQFDLTAGKTEAEQTLAKHSLTLVTWCTWGDNIALVKRAKGSGTETLDLCDALRSEPGVLWAEPDWIRTVRFATNDTYYTSQWYLSQASDADIDAPEAWAMTTGNSAIRIAICDVGVQIAHPDLNDHIVTGYDASDGDNDPTPNTTYENDGHGTCCAGIAAAETNNSTGVAGVGYNCSLLGARMGYITLFGSIQTSDTWIINCINYCRDSSDVMSNSWGGGSSSSAVNTALTNARSAGLTILFAAGNSNSSIQWPATQTSVICVGATNEADDRCTPDDWGSGQGSCYGSQMDVTAPGNNQYATDDTRTGAGYSTGSYYASFGGTSGACPVAAGVCALILCVNPTLTPAQVQNILQTTADDLVGDAGEDVAGWDQYMGWGRVNANDAVHAAGQIVVTYPDGGEIWYTGESRTITWTSSGVTGNVNIELNRAYSGGTWESIAANTANDGSHTWTVAGTATTAARIRITSVSLPAINDVSNGDFSILAPYVTVLDPDGGETWYTSHSDTIRWTSGGFTGNVKIELNRNYSGGAWEVLFASITNDGNEPWTVAGTTTSAARIRVSSVGTPAINDVSNANFTIANPSIAVTAPNGGETWSAGTEYSIQWTSAGIIGNIKVELNRAYSGGTWETLFASLANDGNEAWIATLPPTALARIRVSSVNTPSINDVSNTNFTIAGPPPVVLHDPLDDFAPGAGTVTAIAYSPAILSITSVTMYYRLAGGSTFDSLQLALTGNPDEYAASLAALPIGTYEYYVKATDNIGYSSTAPLGAPVSLYSFDVDDLCVTELGYDDGSAEYFTWSEGANGVETQWAVKFGPVLAPYVVCGARFVASRSLPDSTHSLVHVYVYAADGAGGMPGTLLQDVITGSIGNDIGGVPAGTNWAQVILKDDLGDPLTVNTSEFYIAVANASLGAYEAFGRDSNGVNNGHSYFYDPCEEQWFSENDTTANPNGNPGNRMIRMQGYSLVTPPEVVIYCDGGVITLYWTNVGAPLYNVYRAPAPGGPYDFFAATADTTMTVSSVDTSGTMKFYHVRAASE